MNEQATTETTDATETKPDKPEFEWGIIEIMGHRSHAGKVREEERFGAKMLRIDVPVKGDPEKLGWETHFYGGAAIFSFRLCDEATALRLNKPYGAASRYRLPAPGSQEDESAEFHEDEPF